jgi:hypothetical protein
VQRLFIIISLRGIVLGATKAVNQRKHSRVKTKNLISHVSIDQTGNWISQGMSRALDISKAGILLETTHSIESGFLSLMTVDMENNLIEIKGKLIYCAKLTNGIYRSGVTFIGTDEQVTKFVTKSVKVYKHRKNNLFITLAQ